MILNRSSTSVATRRKASIELVLELQKIFSYMVASNRKYVDPKALLGTIVDDNGVPMEVGDQKDVGEFNINFLGRIEEALVPSQKSEESSILASLTASLNSQFPPSSRRIGPSPLKRQESFISKSFFGNLLIITRAVEEPSKAPIELKEETTFGQIMINATDKDIYQGWEANYVSEIENFVTPLGTQTTAEQECWITQPPSILFLQIQRVVYDKVEKRPKKITNPIRFDKTIYIDRFMESNKGETREIRLRVLDLKDQLNKKLTLLENYTKFGKNKLNLTDTLVSAVEFLQLQKPESGEIPFHFGTLGASTSLLTESTDLINKYADQVSSKISELKAETEAIKTEIADSYNDMRERPYVLHSIWAHSGMPESGHYYAYIYDIQEDKWRLYSDTLIKNENESTIFPGDFSAENSSVLSNAYCLIYVEKSVAMTSKVMSAGNMPLAETYTELVPLPLAELVRKDNEKFDAEVMNYKAKKLVNEICRKYNERISQITELKKMAGYQSINFICCLHHYNNDLYKWCLLDQSVKEQHEAHIGLELIPSDDPLIPCLYQNLLSSKAPLKNLVLTLDEYTYLKNAKELYKKVVFDWLIQRYVLEKLIAQEWMKAIHGLSFYVAQGKYTSAQNREKMSDVLKLLVLRLFSYVNEKLIKKDVNTAVQYVDIIGQLCVLYIPKGDPHTKLVTKLLTAVFSNVQPILTEKQNAAVNNTIKKIVAFPLAMKSAILTTCPLELEEMYKKTITEDNEKVWTWNQEAVNEAKTNSFEVLMSTFMQRNLVWMKWHRVISRGEREISVEEVYEDERNAGIDYLKALTKD